MSDDHTNECGHADNEHVRFRFTYPLDGATDIRIHAWLENASIVLMWDDGNEKGKRAMADLIASMPQILTVATEEVEVRKNLREVERQVIEMLNPEEGEK